MAHDLSGNPPPLVRAVSPVPKFLMLGGVAGACALGVAAGMWARPVDAERPGFVAMRPEPAPPAPTRQLQIIVDDGPAPIGDPLEVLSQDLLRQAEPRFVLPTPAPAAQPPTGLMRVTATAPVEANALPAPAPAPVAIAKPVVTKAAPAPVVALVPRKVAKTEPAKAASHIKAAKVEKPKAKVVLARAKIETSPKPGNRAEVAKAKMKAKVQVAKSEPKPKLAEKTAKVSRLAKLETEKAAKRVKAAEAKGAKALAQKARAAETRLADARAEKSRRAEAAKVAKAAEQRRLVAAGKAASARRAQIKLAKAQEERTRAAGLLAAKAKAAKAQSAAGLRMASAPRCASADPLVCGASTTADRRMTAAYRQAEAAGVPAGELRRQHERWLSARAAAAREAPWAVPDVYQERIAELRDQARYAQGGY